ncbi:MAG TPA: hypothetical protein VGN37_25055 [Actinocatenispora sp.]
MDDSPATAHGDIPDTTRGGVPADAQGSTTRARAGLRALAEQLRGDRDAVDDARARALFATTANLLTALDDAFADVEDHLAAPDSAHGRLRLVPQPSDHHAP